MPEGVVHVRFSKTFTSSNWLKKHLFNEAKKFSSKYQKYVQILQLSQDFENKFYSVDMYSKIRGETSTFSLGGGGGGVVEICPAKFFDALRIYNY